MNSETSKPSRRYRVFPVLIPVVIGIAIVFAAPLIKSGPTKTSAVERAVKVRAITVAPVDVTPRVLGYGKVIPARTWEAVAEVAGQVEWVADDLKDGQQVVAGAELLRIESSNYQLALAQAEAQLRASEVRNKTARDSLAIAEKELDLLKAEHARKVSLAKNGTISGASVDASERTVLAGQTQVRNFQNSIELNSVEHQVLIAQRDSAQLDLDRTRKTAPFDARISAVNIGVAQYANKGQLMFSADGLDMAEVAAQFPVGILRPLIATVSGEQGLRPGALALNAVVRLRTATHIVSWPARLSRVGGTVDEQTQSLGIVVSVDNPTAVARAGERPPLLRNTFVEVELSAAPLKAQIVIPLSAVHQGAVYVVGANERLEIRPVKIRFAQLGYAVLQGGVAIGDRVVTSDLITAVDGMLLLAQEDKQSAQQVLQQATSGDTSTGKEPKE